MGSFNNNTVPVKPPFKRIYISLDWIDGIGTTSKEFSNVQDLGEFLRCNPEVGNAVGYIVKEKKK